MTIYSLVSSYLDEAIQKLYKEKAKPGQIQVQKTRRDFEGDITVVVFPLLKISKKSPEATASEIGDFLQKTYDHIDAYNVIKGFLNLSVASLFYMTKLNEEYAEDDYGYTAAGKDAETHMVEYSSPNTNKPLHLGHIRNNLLGYAISEILKATGKKVIKTNIVNDRGIHICKSMLAWQKWGHGATPETSGVKGDFLVGEYYVRFDQEYKREIKKLVDDGMSEEEAAQKAPLILEAQEMLRKWEAKDPEIYRLWQTMNTWVYDGFDITYKRLGVDFDKIYYESDTYIVGRDTVLEGLRRGIFNERDDKSVWANLKAHNLDDKLLLRSDGTSVYMTQDIGTAQLRQNDYTPDKMIYVVGNEQNHHFKVLALILDQLGFSWAKDLYHMSYGMVELPEGKMKSREGTVVDADDIMDEMIETARQMGDELGKLEGLSDIDKEDIYRIIGLGALKYFILKVDPVKNMTFNPEESIDFNGNTGPFIQYTHARIKSVLRKAKDAKIEGVRHINIKTPIVEKEKSLLKLLEEFPLVINDAAENHSPALIANFVYELVKEYNQFYHEYSVIHEQNDAIRNFRLLMSTAVANVVKNAMKLLGIEVPERM